MKILYGFRQFQEFGTKELMEMEKIPYFQVLGCLMYLMVNTRLDISFVVGFISQSMANLGTLQWRAMKKIFCYLQCTKGHGLKFQSNLDNQNQQKLLIIRWCDLDWGRDVNTWRSTISYRFFFIEGLVSWQSKRSNIVALSNIKAEYMIATQVAKETIGLWKLMKILNFLLSFLMMIHYDNQSCIAMLNNLHFHSHNKHIVL